jgi:DNA-binding NtrC family response regulator
MSVGQQRDDTETGRPGAATGAGQADEPADGSARAAGHRARILIVEDEPWDAELAQRLLTASGLDYTAVVVDTRASFEEQLTSFRPDVILSDYHLPGFSGEIALEIAKERCPDIPFVFWSGVLGDDAAVELIKRGATDYVLKDRPARLPSVIYRALAEAEQRAQLARLENQLREAQRLASLGHLAAAEEAVGRTRQLLAVTRQAVQSTGLPPGQDDDGAAHGVC